jgi:hypothetical protein
MRLRIRTLLLTVALLCSTTSTASAFIYVPILDPFYWLFGGCGYGAGGASGGGYGYVNNGTSNGYGPNPYGVSRCVDDWLGYGYLRNQEGTLGHYPGRPISCYHPVFPRILNPCAWFAPCPLFAPCGPQYGIAAPMVAPLQGPMQAPCQAPYMSQAPYLGRMPYQRQWQMPMPRFPVQPFPVQQFPAPQMMNPYAGNWNDPCGSQCMPQPMMQCQPAQVPVTTWRPVTVDRGNWQRVWVSRPETMMVPQTQYVTPAPAMQMPMMGAPMMDSGCGDNCGGDMGNILPGTDYMPGAGYMPGAEMMQGGEYPAMNSSPGCCGSDSGFSQPGFQQEFQPGFQQEPPAMPQSTMMMSPGSMTMSRMSASRMSMAQASMQQPYNFAPYSSMSRWYSNPGAMNSSRMNTGYVNSGFASTGYVQQLPNRQAYTMPAYAQPQSRNMAYNTAMPQQRQAAGWPMNPRQMAPMQMSPMQMAQMRSTPMTSQLVRQQQSSMRFQQPKSPLIGGTMPGVVYARPAVAGDIHGDHEMRDSASAAVPVVPNSYNGQRQIQQASWSQPARTTSVQRYPNSVQ